MNGERIEGILKQAGSLNGTFKYGTDWQGLGAVPKENSELLRQCPYLRNVQPTLTIQIQAVSHLLACGAPGGGGGERER